MDEARATYVADAMDIIKPLSIPRLVGTPGDTTAAREIERVLAAKQIPFEVEEFTAGTLHMRVLNRIFFPLVGMEMILLFVLALFGAWVPMTILAIAGIVISLRIHLFIPWVLSKTVHVGKNLPSKNYVFRAPQAGSATSDEVKWDIYFLAHWDSKSERNPVWLLFPITIIGEFLNLIFCIHVLLALAIGAFTVPPNPWQFIWGAIFGALTFLQLANAMGNDSAGALDDASGVGCCVALFKTFQQAPLPPAVRVTFVLTGMEEFGDKGGRKFLERHQGEFDPALAHFVVLDTIGDGGTVYHNTHGLFPVKAYDPELAAAIEAVRRKHPERFSHVKHLYVPPAPVITDHVPFHQAGFNSLIIESSTFKTHSRKDTVDAIQPDQLGECIDLLVTLISELDVTKKA